MVLFGVLSLAACASQPTGSSLPKSGVYKVGKPYQINGVWYYPNEDYAYDETGIGSWYGPGFHAKVTANGEVYDENDMTAAHRTLPMPSLVRVTNLDNGRSIIVRINDRGPYANNRVIDVSRRGAQLLGYEKTGTAKLRVQILADESRQIAAAARRGTPAPILAETDGQAPKSAPRSKIEVAGLPGSGPSAPLPPVAKGVGVVGTAEILPPATVAGAVVDGRFVPAPVVTNLPVHKGGQIYVQIGAFGSAENVARARARLSSIGQQTQVSQTALGAQKLQRVRVGPMDTVDKADTVLAQVIQAGLMEAKIVVE